MIATAELSPQLTTSSPTVSWRMPHHRVGAILHSSLDESGEEDFSLGVKGAADVCGRILNRERLLEYTDRLYASVSTQLGFEYRKNDEAPVLSFGPGRIIDFPRFWIRSPKSGWMETRVCMTICLHESQSKIWIRFVSHRDKFDDLAASEIMNHFLDDTGSFAGQLLNGVIPLYREDMRQASGSPNVDVGIKHIVEFVAADTNAPDIDDYADVVRFSSQRTALTAPGQSPNEFRRMLDIVTKGYCIDRKPEFLVQHTTSRGRTGIFGQFVEGPRILFVGIGSLSPEEGCEQVVQGVAPQSEQLNTGRRLSGSMQVTAELANEVARGF